MSSCNPEESKHFLDNGRSDYFEPGPFFFPGGLQRVSYLRPGKLFTCHESLPVNTVGQLNKTALQQARTAVIQMIQG